MQIKIQSLKESNDQLKDKVVKYQNHVGILENQQK